MGKVIEIDIRSIEKHAGAYYDHTYVWSRKVANRFYWSTDYFDNNNIEHITPVVNKRLNMGFEVIRVDSQILPLSVDNILKEGKKPNRKFFVNVGKPLDMEKLQSRFIFNIRVQFRGKIFPTYLWPLDKTSNRYQEAHGGVSAKTDYSYVTWPTKYGTPWALEYPNSQRFPNDALIPNEEKGNYLFESYNQMYHDDVRTDKEFRIPVPELEKVLFHIQYQDPELLGTDRENELNGKEEWLELDLQNPDMEVYKKMQVLEPRFWIKWED